MKLGPVPTPLTGFHPKSKFSPASFRPSKGHQSAVVLVRVHRRSCSIRFISSILLFVVLILWKMIARNCNCIFNLMHLPSLAKFKHLCNRRVLLFVCTLVDKNPVTIIGLKITHSPDWELWLKSVPSCAACHLMGSDPDETRFLTSLFYTLSCYNHYACTNIGIISA